MRLYGRPPSFWGLDADEAAVLRTYELLADFLPYGLIDRTALDRVAAKERDYLRSRPHLTDTNPENYA